MTQETLLAELLEWENRLKELLAAYHPTDTSHALCHFSRVWKIAKDIAEDEKEVDLLVILAASYLHDFESLPKNHPKKHKASTVSAQRATEELAKLGFPAEKLNGVFHAIEAHSYSASLTPRTIDAEIIQDADRLEAMGATGLARIFAVGGAIGSLPFHSTDPLGSARQIDDSKYALDHVLKKRFIVQNELKTKRGRALGERRAAFVRAFLDQLCSEL